MLNKYMYSSDIPKNTKVFALFRYISSRNQSMHLFNLTFYGAEIKLYQKEEKGGIES